MYPSRKYYLYCKSCIKPLFQSSKENVILHDNDLFNVNAYVICVSAPETNRWTAHAHSGDSFELQCAF